MQEIAGGKGKDFCLQGKSPALQKVYLARCKLGSKNSSDCSWDLSSYLTVFDAQPDNFLKNLGFLMTCFSPISPAFIIWITLAPSPPWRPAPWVSRGSRQRARLRRSPFDGTPGSHGHMYLPTYHSITLGLNRYVKEEAKGWLPAGKTQLGWRFQQFSTSSIHGPKALRKQAWSSNACSQRCLLAQEFGKNSAVPHVGIHPRRLECHPTLYW